MSATMRLSGRDFWVLLAAAGLLAVCLPSPSLAQVTDVDLTRINIDMTYDDQNGWYLQAHDEFADIVYPADQVLFYVSEANRKTVPDNPVFTFMGADPGATIWVLPQVFDPGRLSVGVSAEDIQEGTFATYTEMDPRVQAEGPWVKLTLQAVRGPGQLSVWQNDAFGQPIVWMATSEGLTAQDAVFIYAGLDADFNWAFTAAGMYEIDVVASAYLPGQDTPITSPVVTYTFGVESR
jgi:surface-anchored protein